MKKLMMAAAIVCAAVAAQAATVNWNEAMAISEPGGEATVADSTAVYLIRTGAHSQDAFIAALAEAGSASAFASTLASWSTVEAASTSDGTFDVTAAASTAFTLKDSESAYFALISGDNVFMSDTMDAQYSEAGGADDYTFGFDPQWSSMGDVNQASEGNVGGGWYTAAPEPTSGLLLLIGMGALALRRRRA